MWIKLYGLVEAQEGFFRPAQVLQCIAAVIAGFGILWIKLYGLVEAQEGFFRPAQFPQCVAAAAVGLGILWLELYGFIVAQEGFLQPALPLECYPQYSEDNYRLRVNMQQFSAYLLCLG